MDNTQYDTYRISRGINIIEADFGRYGISEAFEMVTVPWQDPLLIPESF
jgi:hypothetical protein